MAKSTVAVAFTGDMKGLNGALGDLDNKLGGIGSKMTEAVGPVGLAVAGVASAAVGVGAALYNVGSQFDEQFDKIRTATGETGSALETLKGDFKNVVSEVPTDFESAGTAVAHFSQNLGDSGPRVEQLSEQMLELSRITGTDLTTNLEGSTEVIKNWGLEGQDMTDAMDELFRASQQSGVGFSDLADDVGANGVVLRQLGFDVEHSIGLVAALGQAGVDVADVMPALSKALATAAKDGKDANTVFQETFDKIKNAPSDTEAAGVALEVFGARAGPRLSALIREGKLSYEEMTQAIAGGKDTILGAGKDTQDFGEKWEMIKNRVLVALEPVATKVFGAVGTAMDKLGPVITDKIMPAFQSMVAWVQQNWPQIQATIQPILENLVTIVSSVVDLILTLWHNFGDNILNFLHQAWDPIASIVQGVLDVIRGVIQVVTGLISGDWGQAWDGIKAIFSGVWEAIKGILGLALDTIKLVIGAAWDVVKGIFSGAWDGIKTTVSGAIDTVVGFVTDMPGRISTAAHGMWDGIKTAFKAAINFIIKGWNGIQFKIPGFHIGPVGYDGFTLGLPDVPLLAGGAFVQARPGGMPAIVGEGGSDEIVSPVPMLRKLIAEGGGSGAVIHHYDLHMDLRGAVGLTGSEVERWIVAALNRARQKGIR